MTNAAVGAVLAAIVAGAAWRSRVLTGGGAVAAFVVGAIAFGAGGWPAAAVLLAFFIPSTLLSRVGRARKRAAVEAKHGPRDAWQVLANGGVAALCVLLALRGGVPFYAAFAGAFAAASADTWGTEIGTLSHAAPRSIVTLRPVAPGISGGMTLLGSLASVAGALCVAAVAAFAGVAVWWAVAAAGIAGALADSFAGATLQALRWCPACARPCETNPHGCGSPTSLRRGVAWIGNDAVNFLATLVGALAAGLLAAR